MIDIFCTLLLGILTINTTIGMSDAEATVLYQKSRF